MVRRYQITRAGVITLALLLCLTACQTSEDSTSTASMTSLSSTVSTSVVNSEAESTVPTLDSLIQYDNNDTNTAYDRENCTVVSLNGADGSVSGGGASFSGSTLTISKAGDYLLEGVLYGSVIVDAPKEAVVRLILNGVQIQNGDGPAIRINQCDKTVLILADESDNTLSDTKNYTLDADSDEPDATLFSKDDLTILGGGSLTINASYKDAIKGKDDLLLLGGNLTLTAADDGITGRDLLVIDGASVSIQASGDGLKTTNEDTDQGLLVIHSGTVEVNSGGDGVQAATRLYILGGTLDITAGGGATTPKQNDANGFGAGGTATQTQSQDDSSSQKGFKATSQLTISAGDINISSADDSLHTNGHMLLTGGSLILSTGDDGIHADGTLAISGGNIQITQSYEGLEGAQIAISGGEIRIVSSDDGINASDGSTTTVMGGPMGQSSNSNVWLQISGGLVVVDADGDGLDSNSSITISGGTVLVNGPTSGADGTLDYESSMSVDGGTLIAVGSIGMAASPSTNSKQCVLTYSFSTVQSAGTLVSLTDADGNVLAAFAPTKQYQWIAISTPGLQSGDIVTLQTGGSCDGQAQDGWFSTAAVYGASVVEEITLSGAVTSAGNGQIGMGGAPGGMGGGMRGGMGR